MILFSKHHNLYNDDAAKRRKFREVVGGLIICTIGLVVAIDILLIMAR